MEVSVEGMISYNIVRATMESLHVASILKLIPTLTYLGHEFFDCGDVSRRLNNDLAVRQRERRFGKFPALEVLSDLKATES